MPIREYECPSCSHSFEFYQMSEDKEEDKEEKVCCPRCGNEEVSLKGPASEINEEWVRYFNGCRVSFG